MDCYLLVCITINIAIFQISYQSPLGKIARVSSILKGPHVSAYTVAIIKDNDWHQRCTGALISDSFVLTAAQCADCGTADVILGAYDILVKEKTQIKQHITEDDVILHPFYDPRTLDNDIALIKLPEKVKLTPFVNIIHLPDENVHFGYGTTADLTGWQRRLTGYSNTLSLVKKIVISNDKCRSFLPTSRINDRKLCAFNTHGESQVSNLLGDDCILDPGSLLTLEGNDTLIGILTGNPICGDLLPQVFTKLASYRPWIEEILAKYRILNDATLISFSNAYKLISVEADKSKIKQKELIDSKQKENVVAEEHTSRAVGELQNDELVKAKIPGDSVQIKLQYNNQIDGILHNFKTDKFETEYLKEEKQPMKLNSQYTMKEAIQNEENEPKGTTKLEESSKSTLELAENVSHYTEEHNLNYEEIKSQDTTELAEGIENIIKVEGNKPTNSLEIKSIPHYITQETIPQFTEPEYTVEVVESLYTNEANVNTNYNTQLNKIGLQYTNIAEDKPQDTKAVKEFELQNHQQQYTKLNSAESENSFAQYTNQVQEDKPSIIVDYIPAVENENIIQYSTQVDNIIPQYNIDVKEVKPQQIVQGDDKIPQFTEVGLKHTQQYISQVSNTDAGDNQFEHNSRGGNYRPQYTPEEYNSQYMTEAEEYGPQNIAEKDDWSRYTLEEDRPDSDDSQYLIRVEKMNPQYTHQQVENVIETYTPKYVKLDEYIQADSPLEYELLYTTEENRIPLYSVASEQFVSLDPFQVEEKVKPQHTTEGDEREPWYTIQQYGPQYSTQTEESTSKYVDGTDVRQEYIVNEDAFTPQYIVQTEKIIPQHTVDIRSQHTFQEEEYRSQDIPVSINIPDENLESFYIGDKAEEKPLHSVAVEVQEFYNAKDEEEQGQYVPLYTDGSGEHSQDYSIQDSSTAYIIDAEINQMQLYDGDGKETQYTINEQYDIPHYIEEEFTPQYIAQIETFTPHHTFEEDIRSQHTLQKEEYGPLDIPVETSFNILNEKLESFYTGDTEEEKPLHPVKVEVRSFYNAEDEDGLGHIPLYTDKSEEYPQSYTIQDSTQYTVDAEIKQGPLYDDEEMRKQYTITAPYDIPYYIEEESTPQYIAQTEEFIPQYTVEEDFRSQHTPQKQEYRPLDIHVTEYPPFNILDEKLESFYTGDKAEEKPLHPVKVEVRSFYNAEDEDGLGHIPLYTDKSEEYPQSYTIQDSTQYIVDAEIKHRPLYDDEEKGTQYTINAPYDIPHYIEEKSIPQYIAQTEEFIPQYIVEEEEIKSQHTLQKEEDRLLDIPVEEYIPFNILDEKLESFYDGDKVEEKPLHPVKVEVQEFYNANDEEGLRQYIPLYTDGSGEYPQYTTQDGTQYFVDAETKQRPLYNDEEKRTQYTINEPQTEEFILQHTVEEEKIRAQQKEKYKPLNNAEEEYTLIHNTPDAKVKYTVDERNRHKPLYDQIYRPQNGFNEHYYIPYYIVKEFTPPYIIVNTEITPQYTVKKQERGRYIPLYINENPPFYTRDVQVEPFYSDNIEEEKPIHVANVDQEMLQEMYNDEGKEEEVGRYTPLYTDQTETYTAYHTIEGSTQYIIDGEVEHMPMYDEKNNDLNEPYNPYNIGEEFTSENTAQKDEFVPQYTVEKEKIRSQHNLQKEEYNAEVETGVGQYPLYTDETVEYTPSYTIQESTQYIVDGEIKRMPVSDEKEDLSQNVIKEPYIPHSYIEKEFTSQYTSQTDEFVPQYPEEEEEIRSQHTLQKEPLHSIVEKYTSFSTPNVEVKPFYTKEEKPLPPAKEEVEEFYNANEEKGLGQDGSLFTGGTEEYAPYYSTQGGIQYTVDEEIKHGVLYDEKNYSPMNIINEQYYIPQYIGEEFTIEEIIPQYTVEEDAISSSNNYRPLYSVEEYGPQYTDKNEDYLPFDMEEENIPEYTVEETDRSQNILQDLEYIPLYISDDKHTQFDVSISTVEGEIDNPIRTVQEVYNAAEEDGSEYEPLYTSKAEEYTSYHSFKENELRPQFLEYIVKEETIPQDTITSEEYWPLNTEKEEEITQQQTVQEEIEPQSIITTKEYKQTLYNDMIYKPQHIVNEEEYLQHYMDEEYRSLNAVQEYGSQYSINTENEGPLYTYDGRQHIEGELSPKYTEELQYTNQEEEYRPSVTMQPYRQEYILEVQETAPQYIEDENTPCDTVEEEIKENIEEEEEMSPQDTLQWQEYRPLHITEEEYTPFHTFEVEIEPDHNVDSEEETQLYTEKEEEVTLQHTVQEEIEPQSIIPTKEYRQTLYDDMIYKQQHIVNEGEYLPRYIDEGYRPPNAVQEYVSQYSINTENERPLYTYEEPQYIEGKLSPQYTEESQYINQEEEYRPLVTMQQYRPEYIGDVQETASQYIEDENTPCDTVEEETKENIEEEEEEISPQDNLQRQEYRPLYITEEEYTPFHALEVEIEPDHNVDSEEETPLKIENKEENTPHQTVQEDIEPQSIMTTTEYLQHYIDEEYRPPNAVQEDVSQYSFNTENERLLYTYEAPYDIDGELSLLYTEEPQYTNQEEEYRPLVTIQQYRPEYIGEGQETAPQYTEDENALYDTVEEAIIENIDEEEISSQDTLQWQESRPLYITEEEYTPFHTLEVEIEPNHNVDSEEEEINTQNIIPVEGFREILYNDQKYVPQYTGNENDYLPDYIENAVITQYTTEGEEYNSIHSIEEYEPQYIEEETTLGDTGDEEINIQHSTDAEEDRSSDIFETNEYISHNIEDDEINIVEDIKSEYITDAEEYIPLYNVQEYNPQYTIDAELEESLSVDTEEEKLRPPVKVEVEEFYNIEDEKLVSKYKPLHTEENTLYYTVQEEETSPHFTENEYITDENGTPDSFAVEELIPNLIDIEYENTPCDTVEEEIKDNIEEEEISPQDTLQWQEYTPFYITEEKYSPFHALEVEIEPDHNVDSEQEEIKTQNIIPPEGFRQILYNDQKYVPQYTGNENDYSPHYLEKAVITQYTTEGEEYNSMHSIEEYEPQYIEDETTLGYTGDEEINIQYFTDAEKDRTSDIFETDEYISQNIEDEEIDTVEDIKSKYITDAEEYIPLYTIQESIPQYTLDAELEASLSVDSAEILRPTVKVEVGEFYNVEDEEKLVSKYKPLHTEENISYYTVEEEQTSPHFTENEYITDANVTPDSFAVEEIIPNLIDVEVEEFEPELHDQFITIRLFASDLKDEWFKNGVLKVEDLPFLLKKSAVIEAVIGDIPSDQGNCLNTRS